MSSENTPIPLNDKFVTTPDIDLAACLATFGIPFRKEQPYFKFLNSQGVEITQFAFAETSECGRFQTDHLIRCWNDPNFAAANQEHPLIYMKFALLNRKRLIDTVKSATPFVAVKKRIRGKDYTYLVKEGSDAHKKLLDR